MTESREIRVRFAPSPTGDLHIGGVRTALYNWLFARNTGGKFILRIEDTDRARSTPEAEKTILEGIEWLRLDRDECPVRQSERTEIYHQYANKLLQRGLAYRCFCTPEKLNEERELQRQKGDPVRYSGTCKSLTREDIDSRLKDGTPCSLRASLEDIRKEKALPDHIQVHDLVLGDVDFKWREFGDLVIQKSDGSPAYNFAVVVDDHDMGITHVIRGDDHLSNTPRQILLYLAFGWDMPHFAHLPMIHGDDGKKLSKRHGSVAVTDYRANGYLPEALLNALALLGWSPGSGKDVLTIPEMIKEFSLKRVGKAAAIFDHKKLDYLNRQHLRVLAGKSLYELLMQGSFLEGFSDIPQEHLIPLLEKLLKKVDTLKDFSPLLYPILKPEKIPWDAETKALLLSPGIFALLQTYSDILTGMSEPVAWRDLFKETGKQAGVKGKNLYMPFRAAMTNTCGGLELNELLPFLDKSEVLHRLQRTRSRITP